jgi:prophage antirepressor-like protein
MGKSELTLVRQLFELDDYQFKVVTINGEPWWFVADVEAYLEYAPGSLRSIIRGDWKKELEDGTDFCVLEGQDLESLRQIASGLKSVSNMTRHVTLAQPFNPPPENI